ncbi:NLRC3 [Symbiodinium sp. CCMP2592]|nr:NLRC3 [Symbiodinium sp. CCMP2592]
MPQAQSALQDGQELAAALQGRSQLQVLHLNGYNIDISVEALVKALQGHVLKSFVLRDCVTDEEALACALDGWAGLQELGLQSMMVGLNRHEGSCAVSQGHVLA